MNHIKSFQIFEQSTDVKKLTFSNYRDIMSNDDKNKMNALLERDPRRWTPEEKKFMDRMALKDIDLFIGSDGKTYTEEDLKKMGINPKGAAKTTPKNLNLISDIRELINTYTETIKKTRTLAEKNKENYEFTALVKPVMRNLDSIIYELIKLSK